MNDPHADILLIEDDPDDARRTLQVFTAANLGNTLHVVRDGVEALEFLTNADAQQPKLILLDWASPRLGGRHFLQRVRSSPDTRGIPVIVLAASSGEQEAIQACEIAPDGWIIRPFDFERFMEAIRGISRLWFEVDQTEAA